IMVVSQGEPYSPKPPPWAGGSTVYGVQSVILLKGLLADCCPVLGLVARANHQQFRAWSGRLRDRLSAPRERKLLGSLSFCVVNAIEHFPRARPVPSTSLSVKSRG